MENNKVVINPQDVLDFLADGKSREEIRVHYGLSKTDMKKMFQHPDLKGRKTKAAPGFVFATPSETITDTESQTITVEDESDNASNTVESEGTQSEGQDDLGERASQWNN